MFPYLGKPLCSSDLPRQFLDEYGNGTDLGLHYELNNAARLDVVILKCFPSI